MSRFYVGQRVRFVRAATTAGLANLGREAVIVALGALPCLNRDTGANYIGEVRLQYEGGHTAIVNRDQIEPLTPDGWQPIEWSACLWQPEGEHA